MLKQKLTPGSAEFFVKLFVKKSKESKQPLLSLNILSCSKRLTCASNAMRGCSIVVFNCRQSEKARILLEPDYNPERHYNGRFVHSLQSVRFEQIQSIVLMLLPIKIVLYMQANFMWHQDNSQLRAYLALLGGAHGVSPARRALVCAESFGAGGNEWAEEFGIIGWHRRMFNDINFDQKPLDYLGVNATVFDGQLVLKARFLKLHYIRTLWDINACSGCFVEGTELKLVVDTLFAATSTNPRVQRQELLRKVEIEIIGNESFAHVVNIVIWLNLVYNIQQIILSGAFFLCNPSWVESGGYTENESNEEREARRQKLTKDVVTSCGEFNSIFAACAQVCDQKGCSLRMIGAHVFTRSYLMIDAQWREAVLRGVHDFQEVAMSEENGARKLEVERQIGHHWLSVSSEESL